MRLGYVPALRRLVSARQEQDEAITVLHVVDPPPRAEAEPQFRQPVADRADVSGVATREAQHPDVDTGSSRLVSTPELPEPPRERLALDHIQHVSTVVGTP